MDVGLIVEDSAVYSALFALLACVALMVELGRRPKKPKYMLLEEEGAGDEKSNEQKSGTGDNIEHTLATNASSLPPGGSGGTREDIRVDEIEHTSSESLEELAVRRAAEVQDALAILQRTYVDGLLAPRGKYDVALAILNEYQAASTISEKDVGLTMATEAYLSATRSGSIGSGKTKSSEPKQKKSKDKNTTESTTPEKPDAKGNATTDSAKPSTKGKKTDDRKKPK